MASREHSLTRRALLGAAVAVPVAAAAGRQDFALPPPTPSATNGKSALRAWTVALAAFCWAEAELKACGQRTSRASAGPQGRSFEEQEALDDSYGEQVSAFDSAMLTLLQAPAPNLEGVAVKIGLIGRHRVLELDGGDDCLLWLEADVRRLALEVRG